MFRIDHHIHTTRHSPDSSMEPLELVQRAKEVGLSGIVITEHDRMWSGWELAKLQKDAGDLLVLAGVEVSAVEGHFLVYGLDDMSRVHAGIELVELLEVVRDTGAAIVSAHPFRWGQRFDEIVDQHGPVFHGVELVSNNVTVDTRSLTERLLTRVTLPTTGSSDAHRAEVVGCYYTEFSRRITSMADFVAALRAGVGRPSHREGAALTSGPVVRDLTGESAPRAVAG